MMYLAKRKEIPILITGFIGGLVVAQNYFNIPILNSILNEAKLYSSLLTGFAIILGTMTIVVRNIKQLSMKQYPKWEGVFILLLMAIMSAIGLIFGPLSDNYLWFMEYLFIPVSSTTFSLTFFYIISAGIKLLRVRDVNSGILLVAAVFIFLGKIPAGVALYPGFGVIANWIVNTGQVGVKRGFIISIALGTIVLSVRTLLGRRTGIKGMGMDTEE